MKLEPDMENRSCSADLARKAFQNDFFKIYNSGEIDKFGKSDDDYPDIYKISDVTVQREDFVKISLDFFMNIKTGEIERGDLFGFDQNEIIVEKITDALISRRGRRKQRAYVWIFIASGQLGQSCF